MKSNLRVMVRVMLAALALAAGCAHGTGVPDRARDVRGTARVGHAARALLAGPAHLVHATGDKPVRWFVADRVNGDDRDCAGSRSAVVLSESVGAQLTVGSGKVLCASVASGATDVMWHELRDGDDSLWALR